jgi:RNA polymerase sigma-70 factor, ECF subfamily
MPPSTASYAFAHRRIACDAPLLTSGYQEAEPSRIALLGAIANGDKAAFAALYQQTAPRLLHLCLRYSPERESAEEILQESFLLVWQRAGSFEAARGSSLAWLATIVRNRAIDYWRRQTQRPIFLPLDNALDIACQRALPLDLLVRDDARRDIHHSLARLPEQMRLALTMAYFEEHDYRHIAAQLNAPVNTVKSWVRRGLARLRLELQASAPIPSACPQFL